MTLVKSSLSDIEIRLLTAEHRQSVINLLMSSFFLEEPLNAMLKFDIPHEVLAWADHLVDQALQDQCSFVAIDPEQKYQTIVGVILNGIATREQPPDDFQVQSEKLKFIFDLLDNITSPIDLFDRYKTDRLFHCDIINVDSSQRGHNLSKLLIGASLDRARQLAIPGAFVICTSLFSRRAFEWQGFQVQNEILYSNYDRLYDMGIHDRISLLARSLEIV